MDIKTRFTFDSVDHSKENEVHAVISLKAPAIDWQKKRKPVCIVPVIDVSGSMAWQKLEYARNSVIKLIEQLQPGDYCGVVAFDNQVYEIATLREMTQAQKDEMKAKVGGLRTGGSTNFSGGLRTGLEWLNTADLGPDMTLRVIMLTDGNANVGEATGRDLVPFQKKHLGRATVSCFGYGTDCDQDLLADLAKEGGGNYIFIRNPDDALTAFAKELGGLLSRYAQDIVVDVAPFNGHLIEEVMSDVDVEEDNGKVKIKLPEILAEEERHLVLKVKTSEQTKALPRELNVLDVRVSYEKVLKDDNEKVVEELKAKLKFVKAGSEQKEPTKEVMAIVGVAMTVQAQIEAEEQAKAGNWAGAKAAIYSNSVALRDVGLSGQADMNEHLQNFYMNSVNYASSGGARRSVRSGGARGMCVSADAEVDELVAMAGGAYTISTSAMADMVSNFSDNVSSGDAIAVPVAVAPEKVEKVKSPPKKSKKVAKNRSKRW